MSPLSSARLLKLALPLVKSHGFTREALSRSVLNLPTNEPGGRVYTEPLSDRAVSSLFGRDDEARRTLINAWLEEGLAQMGRVPGVQRRIQDVNADATTSTRNLEVTPGKATARDVLSARLRYNEPVLAHLPEAFSLLASPTFGVPPLDPRPALKHAANVADTACFVTGDKSLQLEWYTRRGSLAAIYAAAELHQLTSPTSAYSFLDSLLASSSTMKSSIDEVNLYSDFILKSWKGIIKSSGIL